MTAPSTAKSAQHALEALVLGTNSEAYTTVAGSVPIQAGTLTATVPTAAANVTSSVTATLTGAALGDIVLISNPTVALTGLANTVANVTAADTVTITGFANATGFTGASKVYNYVIFKQS